jgi:hypothetical protein
VKTFQKCSIRCFLWTSVGAPLFKYVDSAFYEKNVGSNLCLKM